MQDALNHLQEVITVEHFNTILIDYVDLIKTIVISGFLLYLVRWSIKSMANGRIY